MEHSKQCPVLPPVPAQMTSGILDMNSGDWTSDANYCLEMLVPPHAFMQIRKITKERTVSKDASGLLDLTFRYQYGEDALPLLASGDKRIRLLESETEQVSLKNLVRRPVGEYFGPYKILCRDSASLARVINAIIPKHLGDDWAILQILQSFGRMRDKSGDTSIIGFLYTIGWAKNDDQPWKIGVQKVYAHKARD